MTLERVRTRENALGRPRGKGHRRDAQRVTRHTILSHGSYLSENVFTPIKNKKAFTSVALVKTRGTGFSTKHTRKRSHGPIKLCADRFRTSSICHRNAIPKGHRGASPAVCEQRRDGQEADQALRRHVVDSPPSQTSAERVTGKAGALFHRPGTPGRGRTRVRQQGREAAGAGGTTDRAA